MDLDFHNNEARATRNLDGRRLSKESTCSFTSINFLEIN